MFEVFERDLEINPKPSERKLIRLAEKLAKDGGSWAEELQKAINTVEESRTLSLPDFDFAMSVLKTTVQETEEA